MRCSRTSRNGMPGLWSIEVLEERWNAITPSGPTIEGVIETTVVKTYAAVVLSSNQVSWIGRVCFDQLLSLPSIGAILIHSHTAIMEGVTVAAANCIARNTAIA